MAKNKVIAGDYNGKNICIKDGFAIIGDGGATQGVYELNGQIIINVGK